MIILFVKDGLGNQLFEYAFARQLQEKTKQIILLNRIFIRSNNYKSFHLNKFALKEDVKIANFYTDIFYLIYFILKIIFCKGIKIIDFFKKTKVSDKVWSKGLCISFDTFGYQKIDNIYSKHIFIYGNFENFKYVESIKIKIKQELKPSFKFSNLFIEYQRNVFTSNSVCVHVRRGDYLDKKWEILQVCDKGYYLNSIDYIKSKIDNPVFYVFTNSSEDIEWINENYFSNTSSIKYIDSKLSDFESFILMSHCKHFIISNSTFSWWAANLSTSEKNYVIAPSKWIKSKSKKYEDLYLDNWIRL